MAHHEGVGAGVSVYAGRQAALRGVEPVAGLLLLEDTAVGNTYPTVAARKLIRVGDDRIAVAAVLRIVPAGDVVVGAFDAAGTENAGVVRNIQSVVCHKQVIVVAVLHDFGRLGTLPAIRLVAGGDALSVTGGKFIGRVGPGVAKSYVITLGVVGVERLAGLGIQFQEGKTTVPGAINEPVTAIVHNIGGVDGIVIEIGLAIAFIEGVVVKAPVGGGAHDKPLVFPGIGVFGRAGFAHADESPLRPGTVHGEFRHAGPDAVQNDYTVIHTHLAVHHADDRGPVPVRRVVDGFQVHAAAHAVQGVFHPGGRVVERPIYMGPVHQVLGAFSLEVTSDGGLLVLVAIGGIGAEHVVVTVVVGNGRVVHVGQVPIHVVTPTADVHVIIGISGNTVFTGFSFVVLLGRDSDSRFLGTRSEQQGAAKEQYKVFFEFHIHSQLLVQGDNRMD